MWDVIVVLTWNSIRCPHPPLAIILFLSSYILGTFILGSEYMSCFTSLMVSKSYITPPVDNVEQLWESKMLWLGGRMTDYYFNHFQNITDIEDRLVGLRWKNENEEAKIAIEKLLQRPDDYVYFERKGLIQWNICHHDIKLNGRRLYYSQETIGAYSTYLYLKKNSFTTESSNRKILILQDMGIIQHHQKRFHNQEMKSECLMTEKEKIEMITLIHMQTGFYLLAIGYLLALFSLIVECIVEFRKAQEQITALQEKNLASQERNSALQENNLASQEQISVLQEKNLSLLYENLALKEKYLAVKEKLNSLLPNSVGASSLTKDQWWKIS